jgi:hypothetical protein
MADVDSRVMGDRRSVGGGDFRVDRRDLPRLMDRGGIQVPLFIGLQNGSWLKQRTGNLPKQ